MNFSEYQADSRLTAQYPDLGSNYVYPTLGLAGEAGEVCERIKKLQRDHGGVLTEEYRQAIALELGDVLWYLSQIATELGVELNHVAEKNLEKLFSRMDRNKIKGEGDYR